MPKSKRNKVVSLTKVKSKGAKAKDKLIEEVRGACDLYTNMFVLDVENMRNVSLKEMRSYWKGSRFFFGKNKVTQISLGRTPETAVKENLHLVSQQLTGTRGLLCTDTSPEEVLKYFNDFKAPHFARSGNIATREFKLSEGPLSTLPFSMDGPLRKLGLPVELKRGVIVLTQPVVVCNAGDTLTPEQCKILEIFDQTMTIFRVKVVAQWVEGAFTQLIEGEVSADAEDEDVADDMDDAEELNVFA
jgi:mRNA turnover protein 4